MHRCAALGVCAPVWLLTRRAAGPCCPRRRYAESWRALARAKELHYSKHTYVHRDFEQMVDDMVQLFPSPHKFVTAVAEEAAASPPPAPRSAMHVQSLIASSSARLQRLVARLSRWRRHPDAAAPSGGSQQAQPEAAAEDEAPAEDGGGSSAVPGTGDGSSSTSGSGSSSTGLATSSAGASGSGEMIPIFVMGMPRSGSTLAEQILARCVSWGGEGAEVCERVFGVPSLGTAHASYGRISLQRVARAMGHCVVPPRVPTAALHLASSSAYAVQPS